MRWMALLTLTTLLPACGYNAVIDRDEEVKAAWAEVENPYKRRADLVPNLVKVGKGAADFEKDTLTAVVEARSKVSQMKIDSSIIDNPQSMAAFQKAQAGLSSALSRLMVVVEKYPELKATQAFRDLQAQLEGTENRITVARKRYIESIAAYNKVVLRFPTSIGASMRDKTVRETFKGDAADATPPSVEF